MSRSEERHGAARLKVSAACAALLVAAGGVVGGAAGASGSVASGRSHGHKVTLPAASSARVAQVIDTALGAKVPVSQLPSLVVQAFQRAAEPLTAAQIKLAKECYTQTSCTVGSGKYTVAEADGFGDNTWREFSRMEFILQALTYPNIGHIVYTNANGSLSTMQADVKGLIARGVNAIITYDDFGSAMLPTFAQAEAHGIPVTSFTGPVPDAKTPSQMLTEVHSNFCDVGNAMAAAAARLMKGAGNVAYFGGTPGNPQSAAWQSCATSFFKKHDPKISVAFTANTNWTSGGTYAAATGLLSSGKNVKAILYDYANPIVSVVSAYKRAGKHMPAIVVQNEDNAVYGLWKKAQGTSSAWPLVDTDAFNWMARVALTADMAHLSGAKVPGEITVPTPFFSAQASDYYPSEPAGYPASTLVPPSLIHVLTS